MVERIESGADRLAGLLDRFEREGGRLSQGQVASIRELVVRIGDRLDAVLAADARTAECMRNTMSGLREELEGATFVNRAVTAYHTNRAPDARFSDRKA